MRVLIIEDDQVLAESIRSSISSSGIIISIVGNGIYANQLLDSAAKAEHHYDAVILDLTIPGMDGIDVLKAMRRRNDMTPVLILTARITLADRVGGLEDGADDYLSKPFEPKELVARLRSITRRQEDLRHASMRLGNLEFDTGRRIFSVDGAVLALPPKSQCILELLFRRRGNYVTKELLTNLDNEGATMESVDQQISRLRKRLRDAEASVVIKTLYGIGYMLNTPLSEPE